MIDETLIIKHVAKTSLTWDSGNWANKRSKFINNPFQILVTARI